MPAVNFSPIFNGWQGFTPSGLPLNGGFLYTYQAGSSTPLATYTTNAGSIQNANPIQLGPDGRPPSEIWLDAAYSYKFILADSLDNPIGTYDNITGIDNSVPAALSEWVVSGLTPSYVSATQFTLAGDQTSLFQVGRRVRYTLGSGQSTGSITASVYAAITTVTVVTDSIPLDNTLSAVDYGFLTALKPSVPTAFKSPISGPSAALTGTFSAGGLATLTGGVQFGSVAGNTLNYYAAFEAFTPALTFGGASTGITYNNNTSGLYTAIGNLVFFTLRVQLSSKGSATGTAVITGLPFAASGSLGVVTYPANVYALNLTGLTGTLKAAASYLSTHLSLTQSFSDGDSTGVTDAEFTNTTDITVSGVYMR